MLSQCTKRGLAAEFLPDPLWELFKSASPDRSVAGGRVGNREKEGEEGKQGMGAADPHNFQKSTPMDLFSNKFSFFCITQHITLEY